jgi:hypothetical protein
MAFVAQLGRPKKFTRPARTISVTLPEDVCDALTALDPDISRAIVRIVMARSSKRPARDLEVAAFGNRAVIVVTPTRALSGMKGVELVPLADGRALIAINDAMSEPQFELAVRDALDSGRLEQADRVLLEQLATVLREARSDGALVLRRIIVLRAASPGSPSGQSKAKGSRPQ